MAYILLIKRQAKKTLQKLSQLDKNRITEKIMALGQTQMIPHSILNLCKDSPTIAYVLATGELFMTGIMG